MILNGRCSQPHGLGASMPLCAGSQLSVQSWLAIVGVEFSLLGTILLPRLASITVSKFFVRALKKSGIRFGLLLNSLSSAPLTAQLRGYKKVLFLRYLILVLVAVISVSYKFSFVSVDAFDTIAIAKAPSYIYDYGGEIDLNFTPMGQSNILRAYNYALGHGVSSNILSANLVDFLTVSNSSIITTGNKVFDDPTDMIIGPKVNDTQLSQVANGTLQSCDALFYLRSMFYTVRSSNVYGTPQFSEFPIIGATPYNNGVRIEISPWNQSMGSGGGLLDITSLPNGSMQAWAANSNFLSPPSDTSYIYDYMITVNMKYCYGYVSWDNSASGQFAMREPSDIQCIDSPFDVQAWNQTFFAFNAKAFIQAASAGESANDDYFWTIALPIVAIVQDHATVQEHFSPSTERNPRCSSIARDSFAIADGVIRSSRTGMTTLGVALQALVIAAALIAVALILWPTLPLVTEWPAQWLALVEGLEKSVVGDAVKGSSAGQNAIESKEVVFLATQKGLRDDLRLSRVR